MKHKFGAILKTLAAALLVIAASACGNDQATGSDGPGTSGTVSGTGADAWVWGTVSYGEDILLTPGARLKVGLWDVSRYDAPGTLIAAQVIAGPGQKPIAFEIPYKGNDIAEGNTYALQAEIIESDGRLAFINDTVYEVITNGKPDRVDMQLKLVEPPPALAAQLDDDHRSLPWQEGMPQLIGAQHFNESGRHFVRVAFRRSAVEGCARPARTAVELKGTEIAVTLTVQQPPDLPWDTGCGQASEVVDVVEHIPAALEPGPTYAITVNGEAASAFTLPREQLGGTIITDSQVDTAEVIETPGDQSQTALRVVSGRPSGSCTQYNGYEVTRSNGNAIDVRITHHKASDPDRACTLDFAIDETTVPLGALEQGVAYAVTVNGALVP